MIMTITVLEKKDYTMIRIIYQRNNSRTKIVIEYDHDAIFVKILKKETIKNAQAAKELNPANNEKPSGYSDLKKSEPSS